MAKKPRSSVKSDLGALGEAFLYVNMNVVLETSVNQLHGGTFMLSVTYLEKVDDQVFVDVRRTDPLR